MDRDKILTDMWLCTDCMCTHANGEYSPDRPEELAEPLSLIDYAGGQTVTLGLLAEEHAETCEVRIAGGWAGLSDYGCDCDCETDPYSWQRCPGCGDRDAGERHAATVWQRNPAYMAQWAREQVNMARKSGTRRNAAAHLSRAAFYRAAYVRAASRWAAL